jgi:hypothetical protein
LWDSPDILEHIEPDTDYRVGKSIDYIEFSNRYNKIPGYKDVTKGLNNILQVPNISSDRIMIKVEELQYYNEKVEFTEEIDYKSSYVSDKRYKSPMLYKIILLFNKLTTNADFKTEKIKYLSLFDDTFMKDLILRSYSTPAYTAHEVRNSDDIAEQEEKIRMAVELDEPLSSWMDHNIPTVGFEGIEDTNIYQKVLEYLGNKEKLIQFLSKLSRYQKDDMHKEDE